MFHSIKYLAIINEANILVLVIGLSTKADNAAASIGISVDGSNIHNMFHTDSAFFYMRLNHDMGPIFYLRTDARPARIF